MELFGIARQQIETSMNDQFRETPDPGTNVEPPLSRTGIVTTIRARLSAELRALAALIEPCQPLNPKPSGSHR